MRPNFELIILLAINILLDTEIHIGIWRATDTILLAIHTATSRLLSLMEVVEGGPRADEVDLGENTQT